MSRARINVRLFPRSRSAARRPASNLLPRLQELERRRLLAYTVNDYLSDDPLDPSVGPAKTAIGTITFRSAIQQVDLDGGGEIDFASNLGPISQWNNALEPQVTVPAIINGGSLGRVALFLQLVLSGNGITVENMVVSGAVPADEILVTGKNDLIENDSLGTDFYNPEESGEGTYPDGGYGVLLRGSDNTISGCVIAGNAVSGIAIDGGSDNVIVGNHIGTDLAGTKAIPNAYGGVEIYDGASNNTIGGTSASLGNLISGNESPATDTYSGVDIFGSGTMGNVVEGNFIGTDITGKVALGNANAGVTIEDGATDNTIGGTLGNVISGNGALSTSYPGVEITGTDTTGNVLEGNLIGTDVTGSKALDNADCGVIISNGASKNTIGGTTASARNLISGNANSTGSTADSGVEMTDSSTTGNIVEGNFIGTDVTGATSVPNQGDGVLIQNGAHGNTIGGTSQLTGNLISGNQQDGVGIDGTGTNDNLVEGNLIGTDVEGENTLPNGTPGMIAGSGVVISDGATANTIGGTSASAANLISGNLGNGVVISGVGTSGNSVVANFIGTNVAGSTPLANGTVRVANNGAGVVLDLGANDNTVGGSDPSARNLISGNVNFGVELSNQGTSGNLVEDNFIGTDATGMNAVGNAIDGVRIQSGASKNTIGGTVTGDGNVIAFNGGNGVTVGANPSDSISGDAIEGNSIFGNADIGIDLGDDGVTANGSHSGSSGPNNWQAFPTLSTGDANGEILATLQSTPGSYRVEFFSNPPSTSGTPQGQTFLGFATLIVGADGTGNVSFTPTTSLSASAIVTATATSVSGNTSEFDFAYIAAIAPSYVPRTAETPDEVTFGYAIAITLPKPVVAALYWSPSPTFDSSADTLAFTTMTGTSPGETHILVGPSMLLAQPPAGTRYLLTVIDPDNSLLEFNQSTNVASLSLIAPGNSFLVSLAGYTINMPSLHQLLPKVNELPENVSFDPVLEPYVATFTEQDPTDPAALGEAVGSTGNTPRIVAVQASLDGTSLSTPPFPLFGVNTTVTVTLYATAPPSAPPSDDVSSSTNPAGAYNVWLNDPYSPGDRVLEWSTPGFTTATNVSALNNLNTTGPLVEWLDLNQVLPSDSALTPFESLVSDAEQVIEATNQVIVFQRMVSSLLKTFLVAFDPGTTSLLTTDPAGNQTGATANGSMAANIPLSAYFPSIPAIFIADPDAQTYTTQIQGLAAGEYELVTSLVSATQVEAQNSVTGSLADGQAASYSLNLQPSTGSLTVTPVTGGIQPPVIASIPAQTATIGKQFQLNLSSFASDPNTPALPMSYTLTGTVPSGAMLNLTSGVLTWTPSANQPAGTTTISFRLSDNASPPNTVSGLFFVLVEPAVSHTSPPPLVTVTSLQLETIKTRTKARTKKETVVVLTFTGPLLPATAENVIDYQFAPVITIKVLGKGKNRKPPTIGLATPAPPLSAIYNPSNGSVTLTPRNAINPSKPEELIVSGARLLDLQERMIDGAHDGQPGSDMIATITRGHVTFGGLALGQTERRPAQVTDAIDALLAHGTLTVSPLLARLDERRVH